VVAVLALDGGIQRHVRELGGPLQSVGVENVASNLLGTEEIVMQRFQRTDALLQISSC
jgi:hypothetical protein